MWIGGIARALSKKSDKRGLTYRLLHPIAVNSATIGPIVFMVCLMINEEVRTNQTPAEFE